MALHFLAQYCSHFNRSTQAFTQAALKRLVDYEWPGNVRELDNVIHRAVLLTAGSTIDEADLGIKDLGDNPAPISLNDRVDASHETALRMVVDRWISGNEPELLQNASRRPLYRPVSMRQAAIRYAQPKYSA